MISSNLKNLSLNDAVSLHSYDVRLGSGPGHPCLLSGVSGCLHQQKKDLKRFNGVCDK